MTKIVTLMAAAALFAFGFSGVAWADEFADAVESFTPGTGSAGDGTEATGGPSGGDGSFVTLGDGGNVILRFTDNTCLDDGNGGDELRVIENGDDEGYTVAVALIGQSLTNIGAGNGDTDFDIGGAVSSFTRVGITDDGSGGNGAEIDAVECLNNFDFGTDHINKAIVGASNILIGVDFEQSRTFSITISNPFDEDLSDLIFKDVVPAEFDLDPGDDPEVTVGSCVILDFGEGGSKGKSPPRGNQKLAPDFVIFDATNVTSGQNCTIQIHVVTDDDHPGKGQSPDFTPTECGGGVVLNDGVEVFDDTDSSGTLSPGDTLLLVDDTTLTLSCT